MITRKLAFVSSVMNNLTSFVPNTFSCLVNRGPIVGFVFDFYLRVNWNNVPMYAQYTLFPTKVVLEPKEDSGHIQGLSFFFVV
jgi:hypothetical protein